MRKGPLSFVIGLVLSLVFALFLTESVSSAISFFVLLGLGLVVGLFNLAEGAEHLLSYLALLFIFSISSNYSFLSDYSSLFSNTSLYFLGIVILLSFKTLFEKLDYHSSEQKPKHVKIA